MGNTIRRFNHRVAERVWRTNHNLTSTTYTKFDHVVLIPGGSNQLHLENARLLIIADFWRRVQLDNATQLGLVCESASDEVLQEAFELGVELKNIAQPRYGNCIGARDFLRNTECDKLILCGRLLEGQTELVRDYLPDYGADALRIYFLFQGPFYRDFYFAPHLLKGAFRFVQRIWRYANQSLHEDAHPDLSKEALDNLRETVTSRITKQKPHTALAAIMEFLVAQPILSKENMGEVANLLYPFTPILASATSELLATSCSPIKDDNSR